MGHRSLSRHVPSGTIVLNPPSIPPADLVAIEVLPTNLLYGMPTPGTPIQEITVQATYGGVTGSAPIQVSVPNQ